MHHGKAQLFLLTGLWLSFTALVLGGTLLNPSKPIALNSQALLYKLALKDVQTSPALAPAEGRAIIADLNKMKVTLYENNVATATFPILSIGKEGTPWETPTGTYSIQTKEPVHFSTIGRVLMPWSMQFYGNFFIHGWPTYSDGKPVPKGYSGGCIRLDTEDAKLVYGFAEQGTAFIVSQGQDPTVFATSSRYYLRGQGPLPEVTAGALLVGDIDTGKVLWERSGGNKLPIKQLSALITGITNLETINQYNLVRMGELLLGKSIIRTNKSEALDEIPIGALIYPFLFDANDTAAKAFSMVHGQKRFVRTMNEKVAAIGMADTIFNGPLSSDENTSTAKDMFLLAQYLNQNKQFILGVTRAKNKIYYDDDNYKRFTWTNKNPWASSSDPLYRGGIGIPSDNGGGDALLLFSLPLSEFENRTLAFVLIDSKDMMGDIDRMRTFIAEHFVYGVEVQGDLILEKDEPTPPLLQKRSFLRILEDLLNGTVSYQSK